MLASDTWVIKMFFKIFLIGWAMRYMPVNPAFGMVRQNDPEYRAILGLQIQSQKRGGVPLYNNK